MLDLLGRTVLQLSDEAQTAGRSTLDVDTSALTAGTYVVRVAVGGGDGSLLVRRFTVVR